MEIEEEMSEEIDEDQREAAIEDDMETQDDLHDLEGSVVPVAQEDHNLLKFLKDDVLESKDRYKTGYLTWEELGKPTFSTRFWLNLSNTCEVLFGFDTVARYCRSKAAITSDTSLSRDGFIITTAVTQRKLKEKKSSSELAAYLKGQGK